ARAAQFATRSRRLTDRRGRVGPVHLVQVDVVGAQRLRAGLDALPQPGRAGVADQPVAVHPQPALADAAIGSAHLICSVYDCHTWSPVAVVLSGGVDLSRGANGGIG